MSVHEILNDLSTYFDKYDTMNYDFANIKANCEINNFIKLSNKFEHAKFIKEIPNVIRSCGKFNYESKINLKSYIKKIVYKDDDINLENEKENGTGAVNIVKEKINQRLKMKLGKCSKMAIKMKNENERKKMNIGKSVHLNINFHDINNMNGKVYQLGLRIGNKNTTTMDKLIQCFNKLKLNKNNKNNNDEYINQCVSLKLVGEFDKINTMNSNIKVELQTNTTAVKNGFWFYFLIIIKKNQEMLVSEPFTLLSYKQLTKRKEKSFLKKQEEYMLNNEESIFPYYFESMFYYNDEDNQYKLKKTFTFEIKFCQERRNENNYNEKVNSKSIMINTNKDIDITQGTEELVKELNQFYPMISDIPLENNTIEKEKVIFTGFPNTLEMNNNECLSPCFNNSNELSNNTGFPNTPEMNNNECLSPSFNNSNELFNNNSDNSYDIKNMIYPSLSRDLSDIYSNSDTQSPLSLSLSSQLSSPNPTNYNLENSYTINRLLSLIYEKKCIINELNRLEMERNRLIYMSNVINESEIINRYNIILNQQKVLYQKLEEGKKEKEYLEEIIYNSKFINFEKTQKDKAFLSDFNPKIKMDIDQCIPLNSF